MIPERMRQFRDIFPAKLTERDQDDNDNFVYAWTEQFIDPETGALQDADPARTGTVESGMAFALNNAEVDVTDEPVVWLRPRGVIEGVLAYEFDDSGLGSARVVMGYITSETLDADGNYPGVISTFNAETHTWSNGADVIKIRASNSEDLVEEKRYLVRYAGVNGSNQSVYTTDYFPEFDDSLARETINVVTGICPIYEDVDVSGPAGGDLGGTYPNPTVTTVTGGTW